MHLGACAFRCLAAFVQGDAYGNLFVAGYTRSSTLDGFCNAGASDVFLMSFDGSGVWQWTAVRGGSIDEYAYALQALSVFSKCCFSRPAGLLE